MHIFYSPDIKSNSYTLSESESKHCIRVLRLKKGSDLYLVDGMGGLYHAKMIDDNPKHCKVAVNKHTKSYNKRNYNLTIAIAPTKNIDRFEWFLEKATEIGIDTIIPFISKQSERKVIKPERLNRIVMSAMKQSQQAYLPKIEELCTFKQLMTIKVCENRFIAHCVDNEKTLLQNNITKNSDNIILIGPEGDFTSEEIEMAMSKNYKPVSLGKSRLRTETAGVVAVHTVSIINS